jgi:hypothetical protein
MSCQHHESSPNNLTVVVWGLRLDELHMIQVLKGDRVVTTTRSMCFLSDISLKIRSNKARAKRTLEQLATRGVGSHTTFDPEPLQEYPMRERLL